MVEEQLEKTTNKKSQKKSKKNNKKTLDILAKAVIDNIVFNKTEAVAYYRISNRNYDFRTAESKAGLIQQITNGFSNLMSDRNDPIEMHLINTTIPVDVKAWRQQIDNFSNNMPRPPGFKNFIEEQEQFLYNEFYTNQIVYLGINLGKRGALNTSQINIFETGVKAAVELGKEWLSKALAIPTEDISDSEERVFRKIEETYFQNISVGHLQAERCTAEEILLLMKRPLYPMMPPPYLDVDHENRLGEGDLAIECGGVIENKYRWLRIEQIINGEVYEGYRATLSMSKFPRRMDFPRNLPFLLGLQKMGLPFTTFARFELLPSKKMKSDLSKKEKEAQDEINNYRSSANASDPSVSGAPQDIIDSVTDLQTTKDILSADKTAWFKGSFFIVVETPNEKMLRKYISIIKQSYADIDVNISWTAGDQLDLFLSQMPGDKKRMKSFDQITTLNMLAASGFLFSSEVGDSV